MSPRRPVHGLLLALAYAGFVSLGLPDAVLGIAWPSLRAEFELAQTALGWLLAAGAAGYFTSGLFAGRFIARAGVGSLLFGSATLVVVGVLGYAFAPSAVLFALAAFVVGWGSGAIDSGLNAHAAHQFRPAHMAWLHAAYSAGAALGASIMASSVARNAGVHAGYAILATPLGALAVAFFATRRSWSGTNERKRTPESTREKTPSPVGALGASKLRGVRLGVLAFFVYSGVELGTGHWAYSILVQSRSFSPEAAGLVVSAYWASIFFGRVAAGFTVERLGNARLVRYGAVLAAVGAASFALPVLPDFVSASGLVLVGVAIAPIYPGLMSETPARTGAAATHAVGFQVSAAMAGAVGLPALGGLVADTLGLAATAAFVAACAVALLVVTELSARGGETPYLAEFDTSTRA